ncbi:hypothetical protein ACHAWF_009804 [Thalassiosira exigua]
MPSTPSSSSLETVPYSRLTLRTDVRGDASSRSVHKSGILHAIKRSRPPSPSDDPPGDRTGREEHAFAWIANKDDPIVGVVISHFSKFGFDGEGAKFVPYTSREGWERRYPHARPTIECDEDGAVRGLPQFPLPAEIHSEPVDADDGVGADATSGRRDETATTKAIRRDRSKLIRDAALLDPERSRLHLEIYKYLAWLAARLDGIETAERGRASVRRAGISPSALQNLLTKMEGTFRDVEEYKMAEDLRKGEEEKRDAGVDGEAEPGRDSVRERAANEEEDGGHELPLLETCLEERLSKIVEEDEAERARREAEDVTREPVANLRLHCKPSEGIASVDPESLDFDVMFRRLLEYHRKKGHFNIAHQYKEDGVYLGRWATSIRKRKRELRKAGRECEAPPAGGSLEEEEDDIVDVPVAPEERLGIAIKFFPSAEGAMITEVDPDCAFGDEIEVGDRIVTIDGRSVSTVEDLGRGKDRMRMFGIAKKKRYHSTYLSSERAVSIYWRRYGLESHSQEPCQCQHLEFFSFTLDIGGTACLSCGM